MHWAEVWQIAGSLKPGQGYCFSCEDISKAAECQLDSLLFDRVRRRDIMDFVENIKHEFNVDFTENPINRSWTMRK